MIHNIDRYKPHWAATDSQPRPGHKAHHHRKSPGLERCDVCGELYDPGHSYEVLHHLHGRRFEEVVSQH
jgi:ribosomal protein L32